MPPRWTSLVGLGLRARVAARARALADNDRWRRETARLQLETLGRLLGRAAGTEFGRAHGLDRVASIADPGERLAAYRAAVPVGDWYTFADPIRRMREGAEPGVLWPGLVRHFAQTSGTTAGDKFIPVTPEMFRSNYRASLDIFAHLMSRGESLGRMMAGRCLFLGGSSDLHEDERGIVTADLSGLVTPLIRWPLTAIYSPGREIALMSDWPAKIEAMARLASRQDIRFISGMPSWAGVLMQRVLELTGSRRLLDVWPGLRVFVHGGVRYSPFRARIGELVTGDPAGDVPVRHELYPASEAFIAMQDDTAPDAQRGPALRLLADGGNLFEFVPLEELAEDGGVPAGARAFACWEVERGVRYGVVLTTCAGLWRYHIGDVVEFEDIPAGPAARGGTGPARLRIVGRHRHFINAFGENLIVEHVERAVAEAAAATGASVGEFTAAPVYPGPGRPAGLELAVETRAGLPAGFGAAFDASLKAQNVDYTTKRTADMGMAPPTITPLPPGAFDRWLDARGKLGGQHKVPRCANNRDLLESVVELAAAAQ